MKALMPYYTNLNLLDVGTTGVLGLFIYYISGNDNFGQLSSQGLQ